MATATDITAVLGSIRVSTLVLHRQSDRDAVRYVAARIPQATVVELGGEGVWLYADDVADAVLSFLRGEAVPLVPDSVLATVLFTDLVGSTERAAELGDRGWRDVLERHHTQRPERARRDTGVSRSTRPGTGSSAVSTGPHERSPVRAGLWKARTSSASRCVRDPHGRVRDRRREDRWDLRRHGLSHLVARRIRRGARIEHRQGSRGGFGFRLRRSRRTRPQGRAGHVEAVRGRVLLSSPTHSPLPRPRPPVLLEVHLAELAVASCRPVSTLAAVPRVFVLWPA